MRLNLLCNRIRPVTTFILLTTRRIDILLLSPCTTVSCLTHTPAFWYEHTMHPTHNQRAKGWPKGAKGLLATSAFTIALVAVITFGPVIPYGTTIQQQIPFDILWRNELWQKITGFSLLILGFFDLFMPIRKRWAKLRFGLRLRKLTQRGLEVLVSRIRWAKPRLGPRLRKLTQRGLEELISRILWVKLRLGPRLRKLTQRGLGSFTSWLIFHGMLGAAGLIGLIAHTGMRFGENLNFVLMIVFVLAISAGALVAGSAGLELRFPSPVTTEVKRWFVLIHVLLVSPLPVLLLFHILSVYYF